LWKRKKPAETAASFGRNLIESKEPVLPAATSFSAGPPLLRGKKLSFAAKTDKDRGAGRCWYDERFVI